MSRATRRRRIAAGLALASLGLWGCQQKPEAPRPEVAPTPSPSPSSPATEVEEPPPSNVEVKPATMTPEMQLEAFEKAKALAAQGRAGEAYTVFMEVLEGPDVGLAVSAGLVGAEMAEISAQPGEVSRLYERLLRMAPKMAEVHLVSGRHFLRAGDLARGIERLRTATTLQPDLLPAWLSLGQILIQQGRNEEGAAALLQYEQRLAKLEGRLHDELTPLGDRLAVVQLMATLNDDRSTEALVKALKSTEPAIRASVGEALSDDDDPSALIALSEAALDERDPDVKRVLMAALVNAREAVRRSMDPGTTP